MRGVRTAGWLRSKNCIIENEMERWRKVNSWGFQVVSYSRRRRLPSFLLLSKQSMEKIAWAVEQQQEQEYISNNPFSFLRFLLPLLHLENDYLALQLFPLFLSIIFMTCLGKLSSCFPCKCTQVPPKIVLPICSAVYLLTVILEGGNIVS